MPRHKTLNESGALISSFVDENGNVCHEKNSVVIQQTCARVKVDIQLLFVPESNHSWVRKWTKRSPKMIRKLVLGNADVPFEGVVAELIRFCGAHGKRLVACRMQLNKPKRRDTCWVNPEVSQALQEVNVARTTVERVKNDGRVGLRFYEKMLRLQEADVLISWKETAQRLEAEINNFQRPFEF